eukprot:105179-Prorocentrum_minimum.AAC.1
MNLRASGARLWADGADSRANAARSCVQKGLIGKRAVGAAQGLQDPPLNPLLPPSQPPLNPLLTHLEDAT